MQTFKTHSKYFIIAALTLSIVGGVFAQVSIPTGLTNAVQYIMETVWTDDGTDTGLVNVQIDDTNIYVRTGFLADGTGWNSKALGVDSSGNVVYVNANAINTPFFNLAGNYIPKINQAGDDLELSTMFQGTLGDISVGHINPLAKMHIQGDFRVDTISGSLMQYTYSTGGTQVIGAVTAPDPSQLCNCDTTTNALDCTAPSFTTGLVQGAGQFCVDITFSGGGTRNYRVYMQNTTNINQGAFIVTGNRAGVMTLTPQATLDVNGNIMIANIPQNLTPTQVLVPGPNGEVQYAPFPTGSTGEINNGLNVGFGLQIFKDKMGVDLRFRTILGGGLTTVTQQADTVTINTPAQTLSLVGNTLSISSGNFVTLPAGSSTSAWNTGGNIGTIAGTDFIGTTDNMALDFRTNNTLIGRLFTNGSLMRGRSNTINPSSTGSVIGGGQSNTINGINFGVIGGGNGNTISASYATIAGGSFNTASGLNSFIGGGSQNVAGGQNSIVVGGDNNLANGSFATIAGGQFNQALGNHSFAAGQNAMATHNNSFVRSYGQGNGFSLFNNEFMVNSPRVIMGDIVNAGPLMGAYNSNMVSTYLPGLVGIDFMFGGTLITENVSVQQQLISDGSIKTNAVYKKISSVSIASYSATITDHIIILNTQSTVTLPTCNGPGIGREIVIANPASLNSAVQPIGDTVQMGSTNTYICNGSSRTKIADVSNT